MKRKLISLLIIVILLGCSRYGLETVNSVINGTRDESSVELNVGIDAESHSNIKQGLNDEGGVETPATSLIKLELSLSKAPALGKTAEITATITSKLKNKFNDTYDALANIALPEGFELINGNLTWQGLLKPETNFSIVIKSIKTGNWTIESTVRTPVTGNTWFGGRDFIYITILEDNAIVSETPFQKSAESCEEIYVDGELLQCTTAEPTWRFY